SQLKAAINVLEVTAVQADFDLLASCYDHPEACDTLNIDGLQRLRLTLQRLRKQASPEQRARLDKIFSTQLFGTGERLVELEESPMSESEAKRFLGGRNLRYNAAAYFANQWQDVPELREPWRSASGAVDVLTALVHASEERAEGEGEHPVSPGGKEKIEKRVLSARLLAKMQGTSKKPIADFDLPGFFLSVMADEIGAPYDSALEDFHTLESSQDQHAEMLMPKSREPADTYVRDVASAGLQDLGYVV